MAFSSSRRRALGAAAGVIGLSMVLASCADTAEDGGGGGSAAGPGEVETEVDCSVYEEFGDLEGTEVSVYTSIIAPEDEVHIASYEPFEECTGATVNYEGSSEFEAQLVVRVQSGNAPDIAYLPQPGLLQTLVRDSGALLPAPEQVSSLVDENWPEVWREYGSVDGTLYAAPLGSNVKSFVWYSPSMFEEAGYEIPETWEDMLAISDDVVANGGKPWCAGIGSGDATGWPATDWLEDVMLRTGGPDVYDQWVNHEIPFNDPQVATALEEVGGILKNEDYVNGGLGGVQSIASTTFQDAGLPILDGACYMHRQASFYQAQWPEGTEVAEDGDVFAFYLPQIEGEGRPVLVGGEFVAAFADRPEVQAFQTYLASTDWANVKAEVSPPGWVSANTGLDATKLVSPIDQLSAEILQDPEAVARFDGSDLMPGEVGAGAFWSEMTSWIANDKPNQAVLDAIERAWP